MKQSCVVVILLSLAFSTALLADPTPATPTAANPKVAQIIEQQRGAATPRTQFIPYYSFAGADETTLFLVSKITDPLEIDIFATSAAGEQIHLGRETLPPSQSLSLNLRERLAAGSEAFATGNLRLDFVGDGGALQAWAVVKSGRQTFEVPFIPSDKVAPNEMLSYWDNSIAGIRPRPGVAYLLTNTTTTSVPYTLTLSRGTRVVRTESGTLAPLQTRTHVVSDGETNNRGWLRLRHSGGAGAVIGAGVIASDERLAYLPMVAPDATRRGPGFEILRIPEGQGKRGRARITLFNPSDVPQAVTIEGLAQTSGALLGATEVALGAWEVQSVSVEKAFGRAMPSEARLRVRGSEKTLMVDGVVITSAGELLDISVHAATSAHKSGTYPVPDLDRHEVRTTIINLGSESTEIVAQYSWDGGAYAVPVMTIPAGGSAVLDPSQLAAKATPDALDRTLPMDGRHVALKWGVLRGSKELIGRTEARPRDGDDGFGFNCGGCCWQIPEGSIEPYEVEVGVGEYVSFTSVVYYWTCSGRLGPYESGGWSSSVPWPFSWDFLNITTSDGADAAIFWDGIAEQTDYQCLISREPIAGSGSAKACRKKWNPNGYNKLRPCVEQTGSCSTCKSCCQALYNEQVCGGADPRILERELEDCTFRCVIEMNCPN